MDKDKTNNIKITSPAFKNEEKIPSKHTCEGQNISPALKFEHIPKEAKSLVLLVDDPDVPKEIRADGVFDHWTLFNIPPQTKEIPEDGSVGTLGVNGAGNREYTGPCPPTQFEPTKHRYFFRIYALDTVLGLKEGATKDEVKKAMEGHIISKGKLMGTFDRK